MSTDVNRVGPTAISVPSAYIIGLSAVLGALSAALIVALWLLLSTLFSEFITQPSLAWALLTGAVMGPLVAAMRQGRDTPRSWALGLGAGVAALWLALSGGNPLRIPEPNLWNPVGAFIAFPLVGLVIRRGLREVNVAAPQEHTWQLVLLRMLRGFALVFYVLIVLFPFYFMVAASLKSRAEYLQDPTDLGITLAQPIGELFEGYVSVLIEYNFAGYVVNSTLVAVGAVLITLTAGVLGAYAVTRLRFPGRDFLSRSILLIYMFPAIVLVVPLYSVFSALGLRDTLPGLLIVYSAMTIPVALYMLRSYFATLPRDLEESGLIDGCNRGEVIWRITLPLSAPALSTVGLYVFMIAWNEFLFAFMFLDSPEIYTLSRAMVSLNSQEVPRQYLMAGAVIITVPVMVLFLWFEKYLVGGLTTGGVKE